MVTDNLDLSAHLECINFRQLTELLHRTGLAEFIEELAPFEEQTQKWAPVLESLLSSTNEDDATQFVAFLTGNALTLVSN